MHLKSQIASDCYAITKSDTVDLPDRFCGFYVGGAGDVVVYTASGKTVTFSNVPAGAILPVSARRLMAATTATAVVGFLS